MAQRFTHIQKREVALINLIEMIYEIKVSNVNRITPKATANIFQSAYSCGINIYLDPIHRPKHRNGNAEVMPATPEPHETLSSAHARSLAYATISAAKPAHMNGMTAKGETVSSGIWKIFKTSGDVCTCPSRFFERFVHELPIMAAQHAIGGAMIPTLSSGRKRKVLSADCEIQSPLSSSVTHRVCLSW